MEVWYSQQDRLVLHSSQQIDAASTNSDFLHCKKKRKQGPRKRLPPSKTSDGLEVVVQALLRVPCMCATLAVFASLSLIHVRSNILTRKDKYELFARQSQQTFWNLINVPPLQHAVPVLAEMMKIHLIIETVDVPASFL